MTNTPDTVVTPKMLDAAITAVRGVGVDENLDDAILGRIITAAFPAAILVQAQTVELVAEPEPA